MDVTQQIQEILRQINNEVAPQDQVCEHEIARVGGELNQMINIAMTQASGQFPPPPPARTFKEKLGALWTAIKDRISAWLSPVVPWWVRFLNALKEKLQNPIGGNEILIWTGLTALAVALVAALVKSMTLLIAVLAIIGLGRLLKEILPGWAR